MTQEVPTLTIDAIRKAGHCAEGLKGFCEQYGLDLKRLCREGIPLSELENIEDANLDMCREVILNGQ